MDAMKSAMATSHIVIPRPEPDIACGRADKGGYITHPPEAGPVSMKKERNITVLEAKKNQ